MDSAVALVEAYLQLNGYFTVTEYPVLVGRRGGSVRMATDLDILAFRFPQPRSEGEATGGEGLLAPSPDPALGALADRADMIVGEVKEGPARFNAPVRDPEVLAAALARFGCCAPGEARAVVDRLRRRGRARTATGHGVRLVAFGAAAERQATSAGLVLPLHLVLEFLEDHLEAHWQSVRHAQLRQPALSHLVLRRKLLAGRRDAGAGAAAQPERQEDASEN